MIYYFVILYYKIVYIQETTFSKKPKIMIILMLIKLTIFFVHIYILVFKIYLSISIKFCGIVSFNIIPVKILLKNK